MKTRLLMIAAACLASQQAIAGVMYDCKMTGTKRAKGWISSKVALVFPDGGGVKVIDSVILDVHKGPIPGTVVRENGKRLVVKWTVENAKSSRSTSYSNFDYRASVSKTTGEIEITGIPRHFDSGVRAAGRCTTRSQ